MSDQAQWMANNDHYLTALMTWIRLRLQQLAPPVMSPESKEPETPPGGWFKRSKMEDNKLLPAPATNTNDDALALAYQEMIKLEQTTPPPALNLLANHLGLSTFDCNVLALCTAMALDTRMAGLCAQAQDDLNKAYPTFALAFALFDDPDWNALSPHAPLRHWRLLEINQPGVQPLTSAALGADERIVNYLKGLNYLDDRLMPLLDPVQYESSPIQPDDDRDETLPRSQQQMLDNILEQLKHANAAIKVPVIELLGHDTASKRLVAGRVASVLGLSLQSMSIKMLPGQTGDFETFTRLWQRESLLMPLALYIQVDGATDAEKTQLRRFLERSNGVVFVDLEDAKTETVRNRFSVEINKPTPEEQEQLWTAALQGQASDQPQHLAEQFSFNQNDIKRLANIALEPLSENEKTSENEPALNPAIDKDLWQACRIAARAGMEQLARRIDIKADWEQLVLPPEKPPCYIKLPIR